MNPDPLEEPEAGDAVSYFSSPRPRLFAHRGASGLAPENTLAAFALATAMGATHLELDVHGTSDGSVVVLHDETVDRTTDGHGSVRTLSLEQVAALDAGHRFTLDGRTHPYRRQGVGIPTLQAVLEAFPRHGLNIEIKQADTWIVPAVVDLVERAGAAARVLLAAEKADIMAQIRRAAGERIATGMSAVDVGQFMERFAHGNWRDYRPPGRALQVPPRFAGIELVNPDTVAAAHRLGLEVHVWTLNDAEEIERFLDMGVDGVMSDLPGLAARIAGQCGTRAPAD